MLLQWFEITRHARGAFWGTGLGPDLCERLGGRDRVLAEAPARIVRPLGDGVWLQLSPTVPADPGDLARLTSFLEPVLDWTQEDLNRLRTEWGARRRAEQEAELASGSLKQSAEAVLREAEERGEGPIRGRRKAVAIRGIDNLGVDVTFNVSLALPPTPLQVALAELVVDQWYGDGFDGAFQGDYGEGGFHSLRGPSVDGAVLRLHADLGTADGLLAIRALAKRFANIPTVEVRRLTLGTEEVG